MPALKLKWAAFRVVQLLGFVVIGAERRPGYRPRPGARLPEELENAFEDADRR